MYLFMPCEAETIQSQRITDPLPTNLALTPCFSSAFHRTSEGTPHPAANR